MNDALMISATLLLSSAALKNGVYDDVVRAKLAGLANVIGVITPPDVWTEHLEIMARTEVIFTSWGAPLMDEAFLAAAPRLRAVFYAAGTVRYFITDALWRRHVKLFTARTINAIPTSEFAAAAILLSLKRVWYYARLTREQHTFPCERSLPGAYRSTVGLVSYGAVGRMVRQRLRAHEVDVIVYDPTLTAAESVREQIRLVTLDELFSEADVVSLHTPLLPQTKHLITESHFQRLRPEVTFINTARGEIVDERALIATALSRPDLQIILDVSATEPPPADSPLYTLPNIILTPHLAGSGGRECRRLGEAMVDELQRFIEGQPLQCELSEADANSVA